MCDKENAKFDVALSKANSLRKYEKTLFGKEEKKSWQAYFERYLSGTTRSRKDGAIVHFGKVQRFADYSRMYDATPSGMYSDNNNNNNIVATTFTSI